MKRIIIVLILLTCLIAGVICTKLFVFNEKGKEKVVHIDVISEYLEIRISENAKIEYKDEHDSWFGEGYTIMKINDEGILDEIKKSSNWRKESDEYATRIAAIKNSMSTYYAEIAEIKNYYWIYKNNYRDSNETKYIEQMNSVNVETYSYLVGIYDIDSDVLYYYHIDM